MQNISNQNIETRLLPVACWQIFREEDFYLILFFRGRQKLVASCSAAMNEFWERKRNRTP